MGDINVAVVLFHKDVLPDLISVCVGSVYVMVNRAGRITGR